MFILSVVAGIVCFYLWNQLEMEGMKKYFGGCIAIGLCFFQVQDFFKIKIERDEEKKYMGWWFRLSFFVIFGLIWILAT